MKIPGHVANGVVVLDGGARLPEGATVVVLAPDSRNRGKPRNKPIRFPLVRSKHPGILDLTNHRIAEVLQTGDLAGVAKSVKQRRRM
jgi:hypothetical protein